MKEWVFPLLGIIFLLVRLWLSEVYLRDILKNKRYHTSRLCAYYLGIAMLSNFQNNVFTLISVVSAPAMVLALILFDFPFLFLNEGREDIPKKFWQIIERLTVHLPLIVFGILFYRFASALSYLELFTIPKFIVALILTCIPMFLFDPRVVKKEDWPRGPIIVIGALTDVIGNLCFFYYLATDRGYFELVGLREALGIGF